VRSIGPLAVTDGTPIITAPQKRYFLAGVLLLWLAADWPMHDIAEKHLYSVHMIQHLLISFIVPPLLLLAMPAWLARLLILDDGFAQRLLRPLTKPLVAGMLFNMFQILTHWGAVVNLSVENGAFHYALHLGVFFSALLMWFPILGPLKEMQMSEPGKMIYLFLMSVVPTVPAGWLTFAEGVVYSSYNHSDPLWGVSPTHDQQVAGVVMKIIGGFYLWSLIALRFMRFAGGQREADMAARQNRSPVTSTEAEKEFIAADKPPVEGSVS